MHVRRRLDAKVLVHGCSAERFHPDRFGLLNYFPVNLLAEEKNQKAVSNHPFRPVDWIKSQVLLLLNSC